MAKQRIQPEDLSKMQLCKLAREVTQNCFDLQAKVGDLEQLLKHREETWTAMQKINAELEQQIDRLKQELNAKAWDDRTAELEQQLKACTYTRNKHHREAQNLRKQLDLANKDTNLWQRRVDEAGECIKDYEEIEAKLKAAEKSHQQYRKEAIAYTKKAEATITRLTQALNETQKALTDCMSYVDVDNLTMQTKEYNWNSVLKGYQFNRANCDTTRTRLKAPEDKPCAEKEE